MPKAEKVQSSLQKRDYCTPCSKKAQSWRKAAEYVYKVKVVIWEQARSTLVMLELILRIQTERGKKGEKTLKRGLLEQQFQEWNAADVRDFEHRSWNKQPVNVGECWASTAEWLWGWLSLLPWQLLSWIASSPSESWFPQKWGLFSV